MHGYCISCALCGEAIFGDHIASSVFGCRILKGLADINLCSKDPREQDSTRKSYPFDGNSGWK